MKILFVCHQLPFPADRGGKIRAFAMIRHLARRHAVTVVSPARSSREVARAAGLREYCSELITEVLPIPLRWIQAYAALPTRAPSSVAYFHSARLMRRVRERSRAGGFDAVVVHCAFAAPYVAGISCDRRVLDFSDLDSGKWFAYAQHRAFPHSLGYAVEARKLRRYERRLATQFDHCTFATADEQADFERFGTGVPCSVVPNGVDLSYFNVAPRSDSPTIVFLGRMNYFPNAQAAVTFVREVFPLIRHQVPDAAFQIVGASPGHRVRQLANVQGVSVTGYVPDVRPYLQHAAVMVAPLTIARGTQNKILEAMAAGVPVVSSTEAAKGVSAIAGRDLVVADSPAQVAAQVIRLFSDPELRQQLTRAARAQVEHRHSWRESLQLLDAALQPPSRTTASQQTPFA